MKRNMILSAFLISILSILSTAVFPMGGTIPSGLPVTFGFGAMDNFASPWKSGQGTTCWDYSYVYLLPGWRSWNGDNPSYPIEHVNVFEPMGQFQVVTWYYVQNNPSKYSGVPFMTTYFNDMKLLFQRINTYSNKKVIVHIEPDLMGFWTSSNYTATTAGVVAVGSTGITEIAAVENNIRGWNRAIRILRDTYAPNKAILAHHISGWCYGFDILNSSIDQATLNTRVSNITNFINSIENGYPTELFFVDPADRDADWRRLTNGDGNLAWTDPNHSYTNYRSFGKMGALVDRLSTNLARRGMFWQIPVGNTYFRTCNNTTGHYRDNYAQNFIPSLSPNGASGTPGDAYSATVTAAGPGYWANRGIIAVLFGPGDTGCTHLFDNRGDGIYNPASDAGPGGPSYDVWGQATSNYSDDDGGYVRLAVARYCTRGKFAFYTPTFTITGTPPTATRTPTFTPTTAVCSTSLYDGETATTNLAYGGFWSSSGAVTEIAAAAYAGTYGMAARVTWTAYYAGMGWSWAGFWDTSKVFNASSYSSVDFYMRVTAGTTTALSMAISDTITASALVSFGPVTTTWQKFSLPLSSFTGIDTTRIWSFTLQAGGSASGDLLVYMDNFGFGNPCTTPTFTITGTPPTKTRTPTGTPTLVVCYQINYDGDTPSTNLASGGAWAGPVSSTATESTLFAHSGTHSMEFSLTWASGSWGGGGWNWAGFVSGTASDEIADLTQAVNIEFWLRTAAGILSSVAVNLTDNLGASSSVSLGAVTATWQKFIIPVSSFTGIDKSRIWEFNINVGGMVSGDVDVYLDDLIFVNQDCRTATPTRTMTRTFTPGNTMTFTPSRTGTVTMTRSATQTVTSTPTNVIFTATVTGTRTPINTASPTPTNSRTPTPTYTRTTAMSPTYSATGTATASGTQTRTGTHTRTPSGTTTMAYTATYTPTRTATLSQTQTATATATRTGTATATPSVTNTGTRTGTPTCTPTGTRTFTGTVTVTFTRSETHTVSPTITESMTGTPPTETNTPTVTRTYTRTPTFTHSVTDTITLTVTRTATRTCTATGTPADTFTVTRTFTPADTGTMTRTPTAGDTATWTRTGTATATPTRTATPTVTETNLNTATPTYTVSGTPTFTNTLTFTGTVTRSATASVSPSTTYTTTRTRTPTVVNTATPTFTFTITPVPTSSVLEIKDVIAYPNPADKSQDINFAFDLTRGITGGELKIYTVSFRRVLKQDIGVLNAGRNAIQLRTYKFGSFANGAYYYVITGTNGSGTARSEIKELLILK